MLKVPLFEAVVMAASINKATQMREREQEVLADMITSKIVEAWNKGQKASRGKK